MFLNGILVNLWTLTLSQKNLWFDKYGWQNVFPVMEEFWPFLKKVHHPWHDISNGYLSSVKMKCKDDHIGIVHHMIKSLHLHILPSTVRFEPNCRMDFINRKKNILGKTLDKSCCHFPFWIIYFKLTIIVNSKQIIQKGMMEHNILKSLQPLF